MMKLFSENCHHCSFQSLVIYLCTITILLLLSHGLANEDDNDIQRTNACSPCSTAYLVADPNLPNLLSNRFASTKPCEDLLGIVKVIKIPNLHRSLEGQGSHRRLISKLKIEAESEFPSTYLDRFRCELVIIESLNGVFADPLELQRLVNRKVYFDAAVFGDANLELPSALSNSSFVEIHMDLVPSSNSHELVIELPLHVRYPPLNGSGYSEVEISQADLYTRCRKKDIDKTCQWRVTAMEAGQAATVKWLISCRGEAHTTVVSIVTFLSALVCALSIVFTSTFYRPTIYTADP